MVLVPEPVPAAAAAVPRLKFAGIVLAPFTKLVVLINPPAAGVKDRL